LARLSEKNIFGNCISSVALICKTVSPNYSSKVWTQHSG